MNIDVLPAAWFVVVGVVFLVIDQVVMRLLRRRGKAKALKRVAPHEMDEEP